MAVDYDNHDSLVAALQGQQVIIITAPGRSSYELSEKVVKAAAEAGVKWVMPNTWGPDAFNKSFANESFVGPFVNRGTQLVEEHGLSWITLSCGFWYDFSLAVGPQTFGFDFKNKKVTWIDGEKGEKVKINTSTLEHCGKAVAKLLSLPELPEDEGDERVTVSQWRNRPLRTAQFTVTQRDILDSVNRVLGLTDGDWAFEEEDSRTRWARGMQMYKAGDRIGFQLAMYARVWYDDQPGDYAAKLGTDDHVLGLKTGDLDEGTTEALKLVQDWKYPAYAHMANRA